MSDATEKATEIVKDTVVPAAKSLAHKASSSVGFAFGLSTTAVVGLVAGAITVAATKVFTEQVAHAVVTHGKVWNPSRFNSSITE